VEVGQLVHAELATEPAAELVQDQARHPLELRPGAGVRLGEASLAVLPLEERVLERVGHARKVAARRPGRQRRFAERAGGLTTYGRSPGLTIPSRRAWRSRAPGPVT